MPRPFYGVLGVGPDADAEAIRSGYRDRVTDVHPDVNDDLDADAAFKRLTMAKETLLDESERERYDRLGHERYVCRHSTCSAWDVGQPSDESAGVGTQTAADRATRTGRGYPATGTTPSGRKTRTREHTETVNRDPFNSGTDVGHPWRDQTDPGSQSRKQSVSGPYASATFWESHRVGERTDTTPHGRNPFFGRVVNAARILGPWILIHLAFLAVAVGTCWYVYAVILSDTARSLPLLLALVGEVALAVVLSTVHVFTRLYR